MTAERKPDARVEGAREGLARAMADGKTARIAAFLGVPMEEVPPGPRHKSWLDVASDALAFLAQQRPDVKAVAGVLAEHCHTTEPGVITPGGNAACLCGWVGLHFAWHQAEQVAALADAPAAPEQGDLASAEAMVREHYRVECALDDARTRLYRSHVGILLNALDAERYREARS